ncbi:MAG: lipid-transfer protein, partial [Micromonosporaceae bacterium]
ARAAEAATSSARATRAARAGASHLADPEIAELHAAYTHQELLLRRELELGDDVAVNPTGGVLAGHAMFAAGLGRIGAAARHIHDGRANRTLAHASNGPLLQQNLICRLESR